MGKRLSSQERATREKQRAAKRKAKAAAALKQIRSDLAKLKREGLYKGDVRRAKGGWRQRALINANRDVLEGRAQVIKVKDTSQYPSDLRARNGRVVVPVSSKTEKLRYDKKSGHIVGTYERRYNYKVRRIIMLHPAETLEQLPRPPKGHAYRYRVMFSDDVASFSFPTPQDLAQFMAQYEAKRPRIRNGKKHGYSQFKRADWLQVVQVDEVQGKFTGDDDDGEI